MNKICKACGKTLGSDSCIESTVENLCVSCKTEFEAIENSIIDEGNEKYLKHCPYCGRPFAAFSYYTYSTGNRVKRLTKKKFCDLHYSQCANCGKGIPFRSNGKFIPNSCSKKCRDVVKIEAFKTTCLEKYGVEFPAQSEEVQETYRKNCIEKYGVDNPFKLDAIQEKVKKTNLERYGVEYASQSEQIRKKATNTFLENYGVGSPGYEDLKSRRESTMVSRYGVTNIMQSEEVQERVKQTMVSRYGVEYSVQIPEAKEKSKQTMIERYGVEYAIQNEEIKHKREQTCKERYGVSHVLQDPKVRQKSRDTKMEKYGGLGFDSPYLAEKTRNTCIEKYGVPNPNTTGILLDAKRKTWMENYGVVHPMKSKKIKEKVRWSRIKLHAQSIEDPQLRQNYLDFSKDPTSYIKSNFDHKPSLIEISETLGGLDPTSISDRIPVQDHILLGHYQSTMERDLTRFLKEVDPNINIVIHDRKEIYPYELDLYLPDYRFAIECDPTSSHNSTINVFDNDDEPLDKNYHRDKSLRCIENNIFLMHVFGYDWSTRQQVIKSMIQNKLGHCINKYYARNLNVVDLSHEDCSRFLDSNHLQRSLSSPVRIGLVSDENELLSVMTFNHIRHTIGKSEYDDKDSWELSRFCNKLGCSVVGGASKLLKYFIKRYEPETILSFSDIAHTEGSLYSILGFIKSSVSEPGYVWVNLNSDGWYNRVSCQKQNLPKLLNEPDLDISNKTEKMIMSEHGFVQVFDSGKIRWVWKRSSEGGQLHGDR